MKSALATLTMVTLTVVMSAYAADAMIQTTKVGKSRIRAEA